MTSRLSEFTLDDLKQVMQGDPDVLLKEEGDVLDTHFSELGYDSLAMLELSGRVQRDFGISLPDESIHHMETPRQALKYINEQIPGSSQAPQAEKLKPGKTDNTIVIDAPLDLVWTMTNDVQKWPELFDDYTAAEIIEHRGDTVRFRLTMRDAASGDVWSWISERTPDPATHTVRAKRIETGWFEHMNIYWEYRQVESGIALRWVQEFHMKPDSPVELVAMTERISRNSQANMERIKEIVERAAAAETAQTATVSASAGQQLGDV